MQRLLNALRVSENKVSAQADRPCKTPAHSTTIKMFDFARDGVVPPALHESRMSGRPDDPEMDCRGSFGQYLPGSFPQRLHRNSRNVHAGKGRSSVMTFCTVNCGLGLVDINVLLIGTGPLSSGTSRL